MSNTFFQGRRKKNLEGASPILVTGLGQSRDREAPTRLAQVRSSLLCLQGQVAKLASRLLCSWSLLRNNNTAINLQMFTSRQGCQVGPFGAKFQKFGPK